MYSLGQYAWLTKVDHPLHTDKKKFRLWDEDMWTKENLKKRVWIYIMLIRHK